MPVLRPRVLLVEDDPEIRRQIAAWLGSGRYDCVACGTLAEAEAALDGLDCYFDVVILDLTMPQSQGAAGMRFLDRMRSLPSIGAGLAITGRDDLQAGVGAMERGALYYLKKPFDEGMLLALVAILRKLQGVSIDADEERRIQECDTWVLVKDFLGTNQVILDQLVRTRGAREQLQKIIDAMGVQVAVLDPTSKVVLVNEQLRTAHDIGADLEQEPLTVADLWPAGGEPPRPAAGWPDAVSERTWDGRRYKLERHSIRDYFGGVDYTLLTATDITFAKQIQNILHALSRVEDMPISAAAQAIVDLLHQNGLPRIQFFRTRDGQTFQLLASSQLSQEQILAMPVPYELKATDPLIAEAMHTRKPVKRSRRDVGEVVRPEPLNGADVAWFVKTILQAAARAGALLCIEYGSNDPPPTPEQMLLIEAVTPALGDVVSIIVRREEDELRRAFHDFVHGVHARLTECADDDAVLEEIVEQLSQHFKASKTYILQATPDCKDGELAIVYHSARPPYAPMYRARCDLGLNGIAFRQKKVVIESDYPSNPDAQDYIRYIRDRQWTALSGILDIRSIVILPILQGGESVGLLILSFNDRQQFAPWVEKELQSFARLVALVLTNIQKMKRLEEEVRRKTTLEDMAMLGAGILHAIKNDLSVAKVALENVRRDPTPASIAERVPMALEQLDHSFQIAEKFSDLASPHSTESAQFSLVEVLEEIAALVQPQMEANNIDYEPVIHQTILPVYGPVEPMKIALFDLFINAIRHMPKGGKLTVQFRNDPPAKQVVLEIMDTGEGMTDRQLQQLFKFGPDDPIPPGGIGLGLYLAHRIITVAQGSISAASQLGCGTTITIRLPLE